jgi:hypothetical protein
MSDIKFCHLCYSMNIDDDFICDKCEEYYCEECSYTFSLHYQHQGSRCYLCADQNRRNKISVVNLRQNKTELYLKFHSNSDSRLSSDIPSRTDSI